MVEYTQALDDGGLIPMACITWHVRLHVTHANNTRAQSYSEQETLHNWGSQIYYTTSFPENYWHEGNVSCQNRKLLNQPPPPLWPIQYIPRNMHTVFALLCFVVVIHWLIFPYPSGLLHWHCGNLTIAPVPAKQPWWIWINTSCEFIMNDCITTTKQSTTKPCAYFLGYTVYAPVIWVSIGSGNGFASNSWQVIACTSADLLAIWHLEIHFRENSIAILPFSLTKLRFKMSSAKWWPFCPGEMC